MATCALGIGAAPRKAEQRRQKAYRLHPPAILMLHMYIYTCTLLVLLTFIKLENI